MVDAFKQFNSLKLFTENLSDGQTVEVDYQVDDDTAWTPIDGVWNTSPMQEYQFSEYESIEGKRIRYRLRIMTEDNSKTPIVKTSVVDVISQVQIKYSYAVPFRNKDNDVDLMGTLDPISADERGLIIDEWANNMTRLTMRSLWKRYDNRRVFINPTPNTPTGEIEESFVERLTVSEL